ncbi:MAG: SpoIIE family protein phosphatase [Draconibacterium sp.]|nr:SpoIIE family protein phosphatase [Draconibacterium sp.]
MIREHILTLFIEGEADVGSCRRQSVNAAKAIGFNEVKTGEIAIVVTELVTNVLKHGGGKGKIVVCQVKNEERSAFEIWCFDIGKGIKDFEKAVEDGFSDKLSLGIGLGSIRRFSDELELDPYTEPLIESSRNYGLEKYTNCIRSLIWIPQKPWIGKNRDLIIGAISKSKPGENLNGDAFVVNHVTTQKTVAAVIDGLGHGKEAHLSTQLAREQIIKYSNLPLDKLLSQIHIAIRGTRGIVIGLLAIESNKVYFSGIGNIEGFLVSSGEKKSFISYGGIVGHKMRTPRVFVFDFNPNDFLCLYSDGITSRWNFEDVDWNMQPQQCAEYILNNYSRENDDTTVLIIRHSA